MFHYCAIVWDHEDAGARVAARQMIDGPFLTRWQTALNEPGLYVGHTGQRVGSSEPRLLHRNAGVILGQLFVRSRERSTRAATFLTPYETDDIIESSGRTLISRYWGRYVAFLRDATTGVVRIVRDPSGGLPCLHTQHGPLRIYASSMDALLSVVPEGFEIDWSYITAMLCQKRLLCRPTALEGVFQVLPGECLRVRKGDCSSEFYWDPLQFAERAVDDPATAISSIRDCIHDAVHAWASSYSGILLSLSGGLDSSIVHACLRDAPIKPRTHCFHYYPAEGGDLDERSYARSVAQGADFEYIERPRDSTLSLEPLLQVARTYEPFSYLYYLEHSRIDAELAASRRATAVFIGYGGDQLFHQARAEFAAEEYLQLHGVRPNLFQVALDVAHRDRLSFWHVLGSALTHRSRTGLGIEAMIGRFNALIPPEIVKEVRRQEHFEHPLFNARRPLSRGKYLHAYQIAFPWDLTDPLGQPDDPERIAPLLSQPVMEACLSVPTFLLTVGGRDRALTRLAFADDLPQEIITRRSKGFIQYHMRLVMQRNASLVNELLMDGHLVAEGILNREKLRKALRGQTTRTAASAEELWDYVCAEAWLRQWARVPQPMGQIARCAGA